MEIVEPNKYNYKDTKPPPKDDFPIEFMWKNVIGYIILHFGFIWGTFTLLSFKYKLLTFLYTYFCTFVSIEGIIMGAHRYFTHKSFKAKLLLKVLMLIAFTTAGQNSVLIWVRDHRLHHKYSDTVADPHNANNGFFHCHMGWLMVKKHPEIIRRGREIDISDLTSDPLIMFQYKYFLYLHFLFAFIMVSIPYLFWGETLYNCISMVYFVRYCISLHGAWCVNSVAHFYGTKPYSKHIRPVQVEWLSVIGGGEGWHNYHHTFPWDYKSAEFSTKYNLARFLIDISAKLGLAYDLRAATQEMVDYRMKKYGDKSVKTNSDLIKTDDEIDENDLYGQKYLKFTTINN